MQQLKKIAYRRRLRVSNAFTTIGNPFFFSKLLEVSTGRDFGGSKGSIRSRGARHEERFSDEKGFLCRG